MTNKYLAYSNDDIIKIVPTVFSIAGLLKGLGLRPVGGNYINIKRKLQKLNLDTSHFTGQGWSKDKQLFDYSDYTKSVRVKKHLTRDRGRKCEECHLSEWNSKEIPLELHHLDGNRGNNNVDNLKILCPNCHAQTENWRNRSTDTVLLRSTE